MRQFGARCSRGWEARRARPDPAGTLSFASCLRLRWTGADFGRSMCPTGHGKPSLRARGRYDLHEEAPAPPSELKWEFSVAT